MIVEEIKSSNSIVRIHDEYYEPSLDNKLKHLSKLVSNSYKRQTTNFQNNCNYLEN